MYTRIWLMAILVMVLAGMGYAQTKGVGTKTNPVDGAEMVSVPAGEFVMGSDDGWKDERPAHKVFLDGYRIYKYEVTVAQYRKFCSATGRTMPETPYWSWVETHPIINVTWHEAAAYAKWAGGKLPTEAQWEKAARGADGRKYPWGNTRDLNNCNCMWKEWKTTVGGSYPAGVSPYGCYDMAGNAYEWCADWYATDYYRRSPKRNPTGPKSGIFRIRRGGAWDYDGSDYRCSDRNYLEPKYGTYFFPNSGFRVALP